MAMTVGTPVAGTTTLTAFLDLVYATRSGTLPSANAVFTPLELNRVVVSWPGYNDVVYLTFSARPLLPESIGY